MSPKPTCLPRSASEVIHQAPRWRRGLCHGRRDRDLCVVPRSRHATPIISKSSAPPPPSSIPGPPRTHSRTLSVAVQHLLLARIALSSVPTRVGVGERADRHRPPGGPRHVRRGRMRLVKQLMCDEMMSCTANRVGQNQSSTWACCLEDNVNERLGSRVRARGRECERLVTSSQNDKGQTAVNICKIALRSIQKSSRFSIHTRYSCTGARLLG
jgi:hypothetical protein